MTAPSRASTRGVYSHTQFIPGLKNRVLQVSSPQVCQHDITLASAYRGSEPEQGFSTYPDILRAFGEGGIRAKGRARRSPPIREQIAG